MRYCLDTSVFITAHRTYYAFDLAPGFWNALEDLANKGLIISTKAVYSELKDGKDELTTWVKTQNNGFFVEPDNDVMKVFQQIAEYSNSNYADGHHIRNFLKGADPWVIAEAKAHDLKVVTLETIKSTEELDKKSKLISGKIKIPNMCDHFGVSYTTIFDFLRALKIIVW